LNVRFSDSPLFFFNNSGYLQAGSSVKSSSERFLHAKPSLTLSVISGQIHVPTLQKRQGLRMPLLSWFMTSVDFSLVFTIEGVGIPKSKGKFRLSGIPTVVERGRKSGQLDLPLFKRQPQATHSCWRTSCFILIGCCYGNNHILWDDSLIYLINKLKSRMMGDYHVGSVIFSAVKFPFPNRL